MDGGSFQRLDVDPERTSWMQHGEPPVEATGYWDATYRHPQHDEHARWLNQRRTTMSDEQPSVTLTTRETIDAWLEAGWATPDTPDWLSGGYVTKERAQTALRMLADQIDALRDLVHELGALNVPPVYNALGALVDRVTSENVHPEVPPMGKAETEVGT